MDPVCQAFGGQLDRVAIAQYGCDDLRSEEAEPDEPRKVGPTRETRVVRQSGRFCPECLLRDLGGTTKTDDCAHGLRILGSGAVARRMVFPDKAMPAGPKVKLAESSDEMARFIVAAVNRARLVETPRSAISAVY